MAAFTVNDYLISSCSHRGELASGKKYWADNTPVPGNQAEYDYDTIGNRKTARAGGNELGGLRQSTYATNSLNQYAQRGVPGAVDVTGTGHAAATVTVNNQGTARKGEYFYKELTVDNSAAPVSAQVNVVGARNNYGAGGEDAVTEKGGRVFVPQAVESYTYDADGNLTSDGRWSYVWDAENRLVQMEAVASVPVEAKSRLEFAYDYMGRRIQKRVYAWNVTTSNYQLQSVRKFVGDGWNVVAELDGNNALVKSFVWGQDVSGTLHGAGGVGGLLLINEGGQTYQAGYDGSGNLTSLVKAGTGTVAASYEYDAFGVTVKAVGEYAESNPIRFSTKYTDAETGLVYYGYRYYQPQTGRWLNRDPVGERGGMNLYGFVGNDPVSRIDPTGLYEQDVHYYLTYFLARQTGCFSPDEAKLVAEGNQQADEDKRFAPAQGFVIPKIASLFPEFFPPPFNYIGERQRERHEKYHALTNQANHLGNLAELMEQAAIECGDKRRKELLPEKLMAFGRYMHYAQDVFSHRGYPDPWAGHGVEITRRLPNMPDKTHGTGYYPVYDFMRNAEQYNRVQRAEDMVNDTWKKLKDYGRKYKCCRPTDANKDNSMKKIMEFLNSNGAKDNPKEANPNTRSINPEELEFKRQLLTDPRGRPSVPRRGQ